MIADDYHLKTFIPFDKIEESLEFGILVLYVWLDVLDVQWRL